MTTPAGDDDAEAFEEAMRGARPFGESARRARLTGRPAPARGPARREANAAPSRVDADAPLASDAFRIETRGEAITARGDGVDARTLRALAAGETRAEARLDLHGVPRERALATLVRFVADARGAGRRAVLVVHGRGVHSQDARAVLKPLVWRWLAATPAQVLAFASAPTAQGGVGATLVLLRRAAR